MTLSSLLSSVSRQTSVGKIVSLRFLRNRKTKKKHTHSIIVRYNDTRPLSWVDLANRPHPSNKNGPGVFPGRGVRGPMASPGLSISVTTGVCFSHFLPIFHRGIDVSCARQNKRPNTTTLTNHSIGNYLLSIRTQRKYLQVLSRMSPVCGDFCRRIYLVAEKLKAFDSDETSPTHCSNINNKITAENHQNADWKKTYNFPILSLYFQGGNWMKSGRKIPILRQGKIGIRVEIWSSSNTIRDLFAPVAIKVHRDHFPPAGRINKWSKVYEPLLYCSACIANIHCPPVLYQRFPHIPRKARDYGSLVAKL